MMTNAIGSGAGAPRRRRIGSGTIDGRSPIIPNARPAPIPPIPKLPRMGTPTIAGGEWPVNLRAAERYARKTLSQIDWSKRDIVLFVSGTADPGVVAKVDPDFAGAAQSIWAEGGMSLHLLRYESSWDIRESVSTGIHAMRLVLAGIAAHKGNHRIFVAGLSQGSWVAGEALADPRARAVVDRAVLIAHPSIAKHHYEAGEQPNVLEITDKWDRVAMPLKPGTEQHAMAAFLALKKFKPTDIPLLGRAMLANPKPGLLSLFAAIRESLPKPIQAVLPDPHHSDRYMLRAANYLRTGVDIAPGAGAKESERAAQLKLGLRL